MFCDDNSIQIDDTCDVVLPDTTMSSTSTCDNNCNLWNQRDNIVNFNFMSPASCKLNFNDNIDDKITRIHLYYQNVGV